MTKDLALITTIENPTVLNSVISSLQSENLWKKIDLIYAQKSHCINCDTVAPVILGEKIAVMQVPPIFHIILQVLPESCLFRGSVPHSVLHSYRHPEERECRRSLYLVFQVLQYVFRLFLSSFSCLRLRACSSFCCCQVSLPSEGVSSFVSSVASCADGAYFSVSSSFFSR